MKTVIVNLCKTLLFILVFMSIISNVIVSSSTQNEQQMVVVKKRPSVCPFKSKIGDLLHMHYTVRIK